MSPELFEYMDSEESDFTLVKTDDLLRKSTSLNIPLNNGAFSPNVDAPAKIFASFESVDMDPRSERDLLEGKQLLIGRYCLLKETIPLEYPLCEGIYKYLNLNGKFDKHRAGRPGMPLRHPTKEEFLRSGIPGTYEDYARKNGVKEHRFPHIPFLYQVPKLEPDFEKRRLPGRYEDVRKLSPGQVVNEL